MPTNFTPPSYKSSNVPTTVALLAGVGVATAAVGFLALSASGIYLNHSNSRDHSRTLSRATVHLADIRDEIRHIRRLAENYPGFRLLQPAAASHNHVTTHVPSGAESYRQDSRTNEEPSRKYAVNNSTPGYEQSSGRKSSFRYPSNSRGDQHSSSIRSPFLSPTASDYEDAYSVIAVASKNTSSEDTTQIGATKNNLGHLSKDHNLNGTVQTKPTETFGDFFKIVDDMHESSEQKKLEAYDMLQTKFRNFPENPEILWRLARSLVIVGELEERQGNREKKREALEKGLNLTEKCLELNSSADGHKWFAIISGMLGQYQSVGDKIKGGYLFKEHIEKAIQIRPCESSLHHLLGRWSFEVSQLGWVERKAASAFFGTPPTSTVEDSLKCFMRADELEDNVWKDNMLWIAKCLLALKRVPEAVQWVERALDAKSMDSDDPKIIKELMAIKNKYS